MDATCICSKVRKTKHLIIISVLIFCCLVVKLMSSEEFDIKDQWALHNDGNEIEGIIGKKDFDINIEKAWKKTKGNENIIIAVIDSGVYDKNDYLQDSLFVNSNEEDNGIDDDKNGYIDDICGWNFYDNNNVLYNGYHNDAHGNCLATVIAGKSVEGKEEYHGVAPECTILPLKVLDGNSGDTNDIIKAIDYAHWMGARIVNCSWTFDEYDEDLYEVMNKYDDILFVCVAGDSYREVSKKDNNIFPLCYNLDNIISVAAVSNSGEIAGTSGYGKDIDVAAPGKHIKCINPEDDVVYLDGTSVAVSYVAGIAALTLSVNEDLTVEQLKNILCSSYNKFDSLNGKVASGGIIDAYKCVKEAYRMK